MRKDWHIARMANDQATLERLTADEFINIDQYGQRTTKSEYIGFIMQERYARQSYSYNNARLLISDGNTAIMELDKVWCDSVHKVHFRDIDTFVRQQDGQWKVTASDSASYPFWVE
ncbi:MAG: nuclear transport factor 2 family protein [Pyrinomonadaceae bacterium]